MARAVERVVATSGGPSMSRRALIVSALVLLVLAAMVVLLAGGDSPDDARAIPTTSIPPDVTGDAALAGAAPTPSTTSIAFVGDSPAPVLGEETGGLSFTRPVMA